MKNEQKLKLRNLLESDLNSVTLTLRQFTQMCEDDEYMSEMLDLMEEALMRIVDGQGDPAKIALSALKRYIGDE